jgi:predicted dienelactone hydrolase
MRRDPRRFLVVPLIGLALLCGASARADDCLTGDTLADQRALAALRSASEASCPCASFDGSPQHRRGDYRRCAKGVLEASLAGDTLRAECRTTALAGIKGATCGSALVTCGRVYAPPSTHPAACKVTSVAACRDRSRFDATACSAETRCDDVVEWTAGTCLDPRDNGPFGIGVRTIRYVKDSVVAPGTPRTLDTLIWYPTTPGAAPINASLGGVVDAPLEGSGGPYPLLMFSHGSCGHPAQSTFLTALLASYGYVVAAPPHPGNMLTDGAACGAAQALVQSALERPADIEFVLDQVLAASGDVGSPLYGAIDPNRIGMSGHSFGGYTTFKVVPTDARFKVAVPLAAVVPLTNGQPPALTVPSLVMLGTEDSVLETWALTDLDDLRAAYDAALPPKYKVEIAHTGHYAFSNGCFPGPDCAQPNVLTQDEAHQVVRRWVLPFLQRHLRADASAAAFFAAPIPPGVLLVQEP